MASEDFEPPRQVASVPGQMELFEDWTFSKKPCRVCGELSYDIFPVGRYPCERCIQMDLKAKRKGSRQPGSTQTAAANSTPSPGKPSVAKIALDVRDIPTDQIVIMPGNPREDFEAVALRRLADGIVADGQLQPGCVRPLDNGEGFELFIGERRYRAVLLAGLPTYRASVHKVTRAKAVEMRGFENEDREDFNPIEKAIWYQQMLDEAGYTQTSLAIRLKITQGEVSNTVRLLKLPKAWQQRVISEEIKRSEAIAIIPWSDLPQVMTELEKKYTERLKNNGSIGNFLDLLNGVVESKSKPLFHSHYWDSATSSSYKIDLKPTEAQKKELDVREVTCRWSSSKALVAFNLKLWKELFDAHLQKQRTAAGKKVEQAAGKLKKATDYEKQRAAERYQGELRRYRAGWQQKQIRARADELSENDLILWLLALTTESEESVWESLIQIAPNVGMEAFPSETRWGSASKRWLWILGFDHLRLFPMLRDLFRSWCDLELDQYSGPDPAAIDSLAGILGVEFEEQWRVDIEFLELHSVDQIATFERQWKIKNPPAGKPEKIAGILALSHDQRLEMPKALAKVKVE